MSNELTTAQVAERLDAPERTIRLWCKQGLFTGARSVDTPRGNYWLIPETALKSFVKPAMGRPPKPKAETTTKKLRKRTKAERQLKTPS
jgi:hypothetical protein